MPAAVAARAGWRAPTVSERPARARTRSVIWGRPPPFLTFTVQFRIRHLGSWPSTPPASRQRSGERPPSRRESELE
jgi:hypothetical protein